MLIVADVHGASAALRRVADRGEPLLVLGDLVNFIDYRTHDGIAADVMGVEFVRRLVGLRTAGEYAAAQELWTEAAANHADLRQRFDVATEAAYEDICAALGETTSYVTYGNVDRPDMLVRHLPDSARFVDGDVVDIEGLRVGFAGGGAISLGTPGEVSENDMAAKLDRLGPVDVLCTHVPPAITSLAKDVIGGRAKQSQAILGYLVDQQPAFHYFGDVHQPQAATWRVGDTRCRNVGYFRATGRAVHHPV